MDIYTGFNISNNYLVFFKTIEDCRIFINYLSSLYKVDNKEPKLSRSYSLYLSNSPIIRDWPIIYPKYVLKEDVDNFIKLMED